MITLVFNDSGQGISEHHIVTLCCRFLVRQTIEERIHQVRSFVSDYDTHIRKDGRTVISLLLYIINIVYYYRTRVRSLFTLVTNSLSHSCLVNLIDVTLACEDANSKLVDIVTVADEDRVGNNLLQISKLRFGQKAKLFVQSSRFGQDFEVEVQARFAAGVFFC